MSEEVEEIINDQLILISGQSSTGKSASLRNIRNQEKWLYMGTEAGKRLPFRNKFWAERITDPLDVLNYMEQCIENRDQVDGIIIDSLTFLMDMYETQYVINATNTMNAWGSYQQFFKQLMNAVARFGKPVIITAHTLSVYNETTMANETAVPIKGALKNNGIEAYFSTVVSTKKVTIKEIEKLKSSLLEITEEERELGFKYVFQTRITAKTTGERIRSPMGMFDKSQTYIDNDAQGVLDHLHKFYN